MCCNDVAVVSCGYIWCRVASGGGCPAAMAGEEDVEGILDPTDERVPCFWPGSAGGCWSTGKKLHSFLSRIQFMHRPPGSAGWRMHLIFRRRQWPWEPGLVRRLQIDGGGPLGCGTNKHTACYRCAMVPKLVAPLLAARQRQVPVVWVICPLFSYVRG